MCVRAARLGLQLVGFHARDSLGFSCRAQGLLQLALLTRRCPRARTDRDRDRELELHLEYAL